MPTISLNTYQEIVERLIQDPRQQQQTRSGKGSKDWDFLIFSKVNNDVRKNILKALITVSGSICPRCGLVNCIRCKRRRGKAPERLIDCQGCGNTFKLGLESVTCDNYRVFARKFRKPTSWNCDDCQSSLQSVYLEFLEYLAEQRSSCVTAAGNGYTRVRRLFDSLSQEARAELAHDSDSLYYAIKVVKDDGATALIPPLAFLWDNKKQATFYYDKLLQHHNLDVKTKYGSVNSRAKGGKSSFFRCYSLNKRHVLSGRVVIVPRKELEPHECVMPLELYRRLNCPKVIVGHRYPTLDVRSITYHRVRGTWQYPCLGISTAIVSGNNADFDGDCLHIIPLTSLASRAEFECLCHPMYNMITQNRLRVRLDHDEVQTLYSQLGVKSKEIHDALYEFAKVDSPGAYKTFCNLRRFCRYVWDYVCIPTVSFTDFEQIYLSGFKGATTTTYQTFVDRVYTSIPDENGIKQLIESQSSRFSIDHLWQIFGEINAKARMGFLCGMDKEAFIHMSILSRNAMIKDVGYYGYLHIKLNHCTRTLIVGYDNRLYTNDGVLVGTSIRQFLDPRKK